MISRCIVWHAHHSASSPLEILDQTFSERMQEINYSKSAYESPEQIVRRKSLFKRVVGGVRALPEDLRKLYTDIGKEKIYAGSDYYVKIMKQNIDAIMALHKKQCGCAWTSRKRSIFNFEPKVRKRGC